MKNKNYILNVPIVTFKMSECIRLKLFPKNTLCTLQSVLLLVLSTCTVVRERNPYYLLLAMQNVLTNQWRIIRRAGPELKQNKKQQKPKVKVLLNRPWCWIRGGGRKRKLSDQETVMEVKDASFCLRIASFYKLILCVTICSDIINLSNRTKE